MLSEQIGMPADVARLDGRGGAGGSALLATNQDSPVRLTSERNTVNKIFQPALARRLNPTAGLLTASTAEVAQARIQATVLQENDEIIANKEPNAEIGR